MIFGLASSCGYSIDYIIWNMTIETVALFSKASSLMYNKDKDKGKNLIDLNDPKYSKESKFNMLKSFFSASVKSSNGTRKE